VYYFFEASEKNTIFVKKKEFMSRKKKPTPTIEEELEKSVYINPLSDFGFKKLFQNKELLISFLNAIIGTNIRDIEYVPNEGLGAHPRERKMIFDIHCETKNGKRFIVEMQLGEQTYFRDRALFYASHAIRKQAPRKRY